MFSRASLIKAVRTLPRDTPGERDQEKRKKRLFMQLGYKTDRQKPGPSEIKMAADEAVQLDRHLGA